MADHATLEPCAMNARHILPAVNISVFCLLAFGVGESETFHGGIDWLRENSTKRVDLADRDCIARMQGYIAGNSDVGNEDSGEI